MSTEHEPKDVYFTIKVDPNSGEIKDVLKPENAKLTKPERITFSNTDKSTATVLFTHSSPHCINIVSGGVIYRICW